MRAKMAADGFNAVKGVICNGCHVFISSDSLNEESHHKIHGKIWCVPERMIMGESYSYSKVNPLCLRYYFWFNMSATFCSLCKKMFWINQTVYYWLSTLFSFLIDLTYDLLILSTGTRQGSRCFLCRAVFRASWCMLCAWQWLWAGWRDISLQVRWNAGEEGTQIWNVQYFSGGWGSHFSWFLIFSWKMFCIFSLFTIFSSVDPKQILVAEKKKKKK